MSERESLTEMLLANLLPGPGGIRPAERSRIGSRQSRKARNQTDPRGEWPQWNGWHEYRRGLATSLDELDVPLNIIQAILRHSDPRTTQLYIKRLPRTVKRSMVKLDKSIARRSKQRSLVFVQQLCSTWRETARSVPD